MDMSSPQPCPNTVTIRRNPHRKARDTPIHAPQSYISSSSKLRGVSLFPNEEILSIEKQSTSIGKSESQNIKVFLRLRPLLSSKNSANLGSIADQNPRLRAKNVWPLNRTTKKRIVVGRDRKSCITINDSQSVTLSNPSDSQEFKRIKSETYGGFSHVFSSDSSQFEVYERMVKPMVDDFLRGKSGMLAALGPSGSGKTHTVFGCSRDPGMVPLALQHIFKENESRVNRALRFFYISIFEIYSERGKAEKLFDLLPDGCELSMQQSTVKGLQEVLISDAGQAESLIAQAVLRRATAMTNTNSQSSRSQCIINIRQKCEGEISAPSNSAVLTIIDLAGAEREKRTGNQGTRLLESNFINNTLMVFGLCLRSLLEHQKNPKKPLQKHFQNSLLTKYLRDYLEGKKRMTLVLTAKSGEEDYLDTSYLLRQASPYMKIKYDEVEPSNIVPNKRQYQASSTAEHAKSSSTLEHAKRRRLVTREDSVQKQEKRVEEWHTSKEEASRVCRLDANGCVPVKSKCDGEGQGDRSHMIMQNFAKALWNVLKQYNAKLKVAEKEIESLRNSIGNEKKKYLELETEMNKFKASCTCCKGGKAKTEFECPPKVDACECSRVDEVEDRDVDSDSNQTNCVENKIKVDNNVRDCDNDINASCLSAEKLILQNCQIVESFQANEDCTKNIIKSKYDITNYDPIKRKIDLIVSPQSRSIIGDDNCSLSGLDQSRSSKEEETFDAQASSKSRLDHSDHEPTVSTSCTLLDAEKSERNGSSKPGNRNALEVTLEHKIVTELDDSSSTANDQALESSSPKDVSSTKACDDVLNRHHETRVINSGNPQRPKRRLMPSSSILLRDLSNLDLVDETEKSKGSRGTRKTTADDVRRTNGSISLIRMLKSNLHL